LRPISDSFLITILDVEGNEISEVKQLDYLDYSQRLRNLNISNNKVNSHVTQKLILEKLTNLEILNDIPRVQLLEALNKSSKKVKQTEAKFNIGCLKTLCKDFYSLNLLRKSNIFKQSFKDVMKEQMQNPVN